MIIDRNATLKDVVIALADGDPGALTVLLQLKSPLGTSIMKQLADTDTTGSAIWSLYKDECNSDINAFCEKVLPGGMPSREQSTRNLPPEYAAELHKVYDDLDTLKALEAKKPEDITAEDIKTLLGLMERALTPAKLPEAPFQLKMEGYNV